MGILEKIAESLLRFFALLKDDDWVMWVAQENEWQDDCDKFNKCYFIVKHMPVYFQHENCRCTLFKIDRPIPNITAHAVCDVRKFTEYVFNDKYDDGKKELFESWGYGINDSAYLREIYMEQALKKYCNGEYEYLGTNKFNAKIGIDISLKSSNGKTQIIKTVWALREYGELALITPYSGHRY